MSQFTPPPDLPPQAPPPAAPAQTGQAADMQFELVGQLLAERARGEKTLADQWVGSPVKQLEALRGQAQAGAIDSAMKGFAAVDHLLKSLSEAKTDADPVPPI